MPHGPVILYIPPPAGYSDHVGLSIKQRLALLPASVRTELLASLPDDVLTEMWREEWWYVAREEQIPPPGDWLICLALAGRGWGKSRAGAEWMVEQVRRHPYDRSGVGTEWLVIAETLSDARLICLEGPSGILNVLNRRGIQYKFLKSPKPMILIGDARIHTLSAEDEDVGRGFNAAGCWCVAKGELVVTDRGCIPVESIQVGDLVRTSEGWNRVKGAALTKENAEIVEILSAIGSVKVTSDHLVWTVRGWVPASALRPGDTMATCLLEMNRRSQSPQTPQPSMSGTERPGTSINGLDTTTTEMVSCYIEPCGSQPTAQSQMVTKSTISIGGVGTVASKTTSCSLSRLIDVLVPYNATMLPGDKARHQGLLANDCRHTGVVDDKDPARLTSVTYVDQVFRVSECGRSAVLTNVDGRMPNGTHATTVTDVQPAGVSDVFDLSIDGAHEFFAGSGFIMIHNCDEMGKWQAPAASWTNGIMPSLRADLIGDHPRAFVTTTPKPLEPLREWLQRRDGSVHVISGSTYDNAVNLSAHMLKEFVKRYAGTQIGEQELYGKLLELQGGGLFRRMDFVNNRVWEVPDDIVSIVVGVDPNLTGEDAETGIVVVCRTKDDHMYVLADRSVASSGRESARAMWKAVAEFGADLLTYEENLGKRWMKEVLTDVYQELVKEGLFPKGTTPNMKPVHSKHGKKTRAEPTANRNEQGRLHFVGIMEELEDQCVLFDPVSTRESPDRMDGMVHACIALMAGEKKRMAISDPSEHAVIIQDPFASYDWTVRAMP